MDHEMAVADVVSDTVWQGEAWQPPRPRYCRAKVSDPERQEHFRRLMRMYEQPPWQLDLDAHHAYLVQYVHWATETAFPRDQRAPMKPFLSPASQRLITERGELRAAATRMRRLAFDAVDAAAAAIHGAADELLAKWKQAGAATRASVRHDKNEYLLRKEELAAEAPEHVNADRVREVLKVVRPPTHAKGTVQPLRPFAADPISAARDGQAFFTRRELGEVMPEQAAKDLVDAQYELTMIGLPDPDEDAVTSRRRLEGDYAKAPVRRAPGEDSIVGEVFAADPEGMAQAFHPLSLKVEMWIREPWAWKGGGHGDVHEGLLPPPHV